MKRTRVGALRTLALAGLAVLAGAAPGVAADGVSPPSPFDILDRRDLDAPFLDAVPICVPAELEGKVDSILEKAVASEWKDAHRALELERETLESRADALAALDAVLVAREAKTRDERLAAETRLLELGRQASQAKQQPCLRVERARLLLQLERSPEAAAQLIRAARGLEGESAWVGSQRAGIDFLKAEILYHSGRRFEAHLAYRKIARAEHPRLALAARLRLTDLSFDAGQLDPARLEYESLLPRATAFGAARDAWSLRAAEAALDAGDAARALRWLERSIEATRDTDARDVAEIRRADLETRLDDPLSARKRLAAMVLRREGDSIGVLAGVRAIDLGVFEGAPEKRLAILTSAVGQQRDDLRRYAMGVLMRELAARDDFDEAMSVATRLAYDGVDASVVPDYTADLDGLLARLVDGGEANCPRSVRVLGGRYGIVIERATSVAPFARLGLCFETMELPWLAVPVYRTISRRFGAAGAATVALAFARSSIAVGDASLARHMAEAALAASNGEPLADMPAWKAILAEADFRDGRTTSGLERARAILDAPGLGLQRASLVLWIARALEARPSTSDARFLAARIPAWLEEDVSRPASLDRMRLLEAGLAAAHVLRRADVEDPAFSLYRAVARHAQAGPLASSARFWLGLARQTDADGEPAWGSDADPALAAPWARVAEFEAHYESLRDVYAGVLR